ncbi:hypothetical protein QYM36_008049 [Artemia franciscana]|uniref:Uncharacterized protein n=1 Tax=Artemia franciscana TaxID=6661 RepID=A0AA88IIB6_ARTSF|nr:hypothetical protein QYM36_008049 [Artemia franciscana]
MKILEAAEPNEGCMKDEKDECCTKDEIYVHKKEQYTDTLRQGGLVRFKDTTKVIAEFQIQGFSIIAWLLRNALEKFVHLHGSQ